jgi:CO/xanthine dehydrogenase Mo-binding subunit
MALDGTLTITMPAASSGAPLQKTWMNTAASRMGIENRNIKFSSDQTEKLMEQGPTILGQDISVYSRLLDQALDEIVKKRFRDPLPITVNKSRRWSGKGSWDSVKLEGDPFEAISWGVGIVEVAVNTGTMEVQPLQVWLFIDGGKILTPEYATSSIETSVEGALNWCLTESGVNGLPTIDIRFHPSGARQNPKDVSTLPWLLLPAAAVQAVRQASGAGVSRLPITPEQLRKGGF